MSCTNQSITCGIRGTLVQDCVECKWIVYGQSPQVIYRASDTVFASGTIESSSSTTGMTELTITFLVGSMEITKYTLTSRQCLAFTVEGFDTITLKGNSASSTESAAGRFCLTPRYQIY